jgi:preprotein translocase subunit SecG
MSNIQTVLLIVHTLIALAIIALVLLQRGKGAEAGAAFGAGASGTVFGARGSTNFFSRTTAILATLFFASSLALAYMSSQGPVAGPRSLIETAAPVDEAIDDSAPTATESVDGVPELPEMNESGANETADKMPAIDDATDDEVGTEPQ